MRRLFDTSLPVELRSIVEIGIHHEQQHQELMLQDIKHVFWTNPLRPARRDGAAAPSLRAAYPLTWFDHAGGNYQIGTDTAGEASETDAPFTFDNEGPRHVVYLQPFAMASRCVTNAEYLAFVEDGGLVDGMS